MVQPKTGLAMLQPCTLHKAHVIVVCSVLDTRQCSILDRFYWGPPSLSVIYSIILSWDGPLYQPYSEVVHLFPCLLYMAHGTKGLISVGLT